MEKEYLHCFLRPVPHLFLLARNLDIFDPILKRMISWGNQAIGTLPTYYTDTNDASTKAHLFVLEVVRQISKRPRFSAQSVPGLGQPGVHDFKIKEPSIALRGAPHHVLVALEELAVSFAVRRQDSRDLLVFAEAAVSRALSLCFIPPGSTHETSIAFFSRLGSWAKVDLDPPLPNVSCFAECFFQSLSTWERAVLLLVACEAGLIHRYRRQHVEELRIHEIVASGATEILTTSPDASSEAMRILIWAATRWKEVFAAAAVYAGHPEIIPSVLKQQDWDDDLSATFTLIDSWSILSESPGNWELRLNQLQGIVRAAEGCRFHTS